MSGPARHRFSADSLQASLSEPSLLLESSLSVGWSTALLRLYRSVGESDAFETPPTADLKIVVNLEGYSELRCLKRGLWRSGVKGPGSSGMTTWGETSRLRWRSLSPDGFVQAHLHMPGALLEEGLEERRRAGVPVRRSRLNTLAVDDAALGVTVRDLVRGMRAGLDDAFVEGRIRSLASRLTTAAANWQDEEERDPGMFGEARLRRAVEFMSADLSADHGLGAIAREAGISVFHFARMFRQATGKPPRAFLTGLRLEAARALLERSETPVAEVARLVGYPTPRNFNAAFARRYGSTPGAWRRNNRTRYAPFTT